jgi:hypothetical protein
MVWPNQTDPPVADTTPPEITPNVSGTEGDNGWYIGDVTVSWTATDPESEVSETSGCDTTVINADTGGNVSAPATASGIKIDKTAPTPVHGGPFWVDKGSTVNLDGTGSTDALSDVASTAWDVDGDGYDDGDPWDKEAGGGIVYDNKMGKSDDS